MKALMILAVLLSLAGCGPDEDVSTVRGNIDDERVGTTTTASETPPAEVSRGAMETQAETPAGPDSNVDTARTNAPTTSTPPQ